MAWTVRWLCGKKHVLCASAFEDYLYDSAQGDLLYELDKVVESNVCYCGANFSERKMDYYDGSLEAAHQAVQSEFDEPTIDFRVGI